MRPRLKRFCGQYFVRFYEIYPTLDEGAAIGLSGLNEEEKKELALVLDEITSSRHSADDLVKRWNSSSADVWFGDGEAVRMLFTRARQLIGLLWNQRN
jgi:hypothetical protein